MRLKKIDIKLIEACGYSIGRDGKISKKGKEIKSRLNTSGYLQVRLCLLKEEWFLVHRLVAAKHLPKVDGLPHVNHKDFDRLNNSIDNLEWCSHRGNMIHAYGLPAEARENAIAIKQATDASYKDIALFLGVSPVSVSNWCRGVDVAKTQRDYRKRCKGEGRVSYDKQNTVISRDKRFT